MKDRLRSILVRFREFFTVRRRWVIAGSVFAGVFLLFLFTPNRDSRPARPKPQLGSSQLHSASGYGESASSEVSAPMSIDTKEVNALMSSRLPSKIYPANPGDTGGLFPEPHIAYSAELSVVTREFARSRSSLEDILERHRGYVAKLRMVGEPSGSVLSATLRVPSSEYRSTLTELKGVGLVEHEEECADEITQQHSDLEARLVNAQNEEKRIQQLLQNRSEKASDLNSLERQVGLLRGEIERIEAERYASGNRVTFANVSFSLREERALPAETIGAKLRNAAVGGLSDAFESISTILLFLAGRGPLLALWAVLIYFPVRFFWRRRSQWGLGEAEAAKNS
jgi:uncharacterized small protein (DUF1192 family)